MKAVEAVRAIMKEQNVGTNKMADRMGKPARLVSDRLNQEHISIVKLNEMLRLLDYKVVVMPVSDRTPKNAYEVD